MTFSIVLSFLAGTVVDVVEDGLVAVHLQQVLEFAVDDDRHVDAGIRTEMKHQLQLSAQFGVQHRTVQKSVGRVVKCKQREGPALPPFLTRHHVALVLSQTARGFQEAVITPHVQLVAGVIQLQGLVRVFLALHQLLDAGESELLKGKRVLLHVTVERGGLHQSHHDEIGRAVLKRVVDLEQTFGGPQVVGPHLASHGGVADDALFHGQSQVFEEISVHFHLAQQQLDLHVGHVETHGVRASIPDGKEFRGVEEQLDADLHLGHQQFTQVKHLDHGLESQYVRLVDVLSVFLSHLLEGKLLRLGQGQMVGVRRRQLIGRQLGDGRVQAVDPTLRFEDGLSIVSVKIQCRVYHGLVGVGVRLGTDERVVEADADLLEERVGKVVGQKDGGVGCGGQGGAVGFLQFQFQLEFALTQIDVFRLRIDLEIHGGDACGERMDGHLATTGDAEIGRRDLEQIQHGCHDGFGTRYEGCRTHGCCCLLLSEGASDAGVAVPDSFNDVLDGVSVVLVVPVDVVGVFSGGGPPSPCRVSWGLPPTAILPAETSDAPSGSRWVPCYPKRSLTARFAAPLARSMAELAFRFTPRLAPRLAPLFAPRMPAVILGSPNGPPLLNAFQPSRLAPSLVELTMSLNTVPSIDLRPEPP